MIRWLVRWLFKTRVLNVQAGDILVFKGIQDKKRLTMICHDLDNHLRENKLDGTVLLWALDADVQTIRLKVPKEPAPKPEKSLLHMAMDEWDDADDVLKTAFSEFIDAMVQPKQIISIDPGGPPKPVSFEELQRRRAALLLEERVLEDPPTGTESSVPPPSSPSEETPAPVHTQEPPPPDDGSVAPRESSGEEPSS